ncbi:hypothetical protein AWRI1499_1766 [Brettanomyces bruxellensis AWRI1499]|nr:hypothetical protein AWRI1499_1766 [Brettanomyces bruxellensis AWRI1499]
MRLETLKNVNKNRGVHLKFGEEDGNENKSSSAEIKKISTLVDLDGSESSDDDAPEEESMSAGREIEKLKIRKEDAALEEKRKQEKERRRKIAERFREQKEEKLQKEKEQELQKKKEELENWETNLPDELPEELLATYDPEERLQARPKKTKFKELTAEERANEKQKKLKEKLALVRELNKASQEKGPVKVKLLVKRKFDVPVSRISSRRNKWLRRKSIRRRL